jgi:hypothetical protein
MNIHTVRDNLVNTIAGKELLLAGYEHDSTKMLIAGMLRLNIDELKRILADVEVCCEKATADSWALYPDRSGGAFTDEEINRANEWR